MSDLMFAVIVVLMVLAVGLSGWGVVRGVRAGRVVRKQLRMHRLVTFPGAPIVGEFAQAMACGAPLLHANGEPWNALVPDREHPSIAIADLRDIWGITDARSWGETVTNLLDAAGGDPAVKVALGIRQRWLAQAGFPPNLAQWRDALLQTGRECGFSEIAITELGAIAERITRYEARLRADGVLPLEGLVHTVRAFDYGRVPPLALWNLRAGYCGEPEARTAVLQAGALAAATYRSWDEYSAGYILGRVLQFDNDEFGMWYDTALATHRVLTGDPASPWRTLAWQARPAPTR
ncbi:hypothetical protein Sru01_07550 [Sphaerisporangium rufum]|uniref:DUF1266 domain-containing protein n=1 Tax=Sphaerisporangium rufum TaxID=1381558 RepID=A0A919QYR4_9ACTN|nr:DUF1266 domain-containing protein [Sphaerisporangium rufum]GII75773.1 hypothetical protein Sru01_07550 [Sphaerisporangium rufum]